jgi:hypothetical protein
VTTPALPFYIKFEEFHMETTLWTLDFKNVVWLPEHRILTRASHLRTSLLFLLLIGPKLNRHLINPTPTPTLSLPLKGREIAIFLPLQGGG